jgi:hypothetical protein
VGGVYDQDDGVVYVLVDLGFGLIWRGIEMDWTDISDKSKLKTTEVDAPEIFQTLSMQSMFLLQEGSYEHVR